MHQILISNLPPEALPSSTPSLPFHIGYDAALATRHSFDAWTLNWLGIDASRCFPNFRMSKAYYDR